LASYSGEIMHLFQFSGRSIFSLILWIAFAIWTVPEVIAWKVKRSADSSAARDQGSLNLIVALWWIGIVLDFSFSLLLPRASIVWQRTRFFIAGICLMLLGVALRWHSVSVLGRYFTFDVAIQSGKTLVEAGPYRYIRHPSYTGALLSLFGFGLSLGNWAGLAAGLCCLGFAYAYRIPIEEAALCAALGETYRQYLKRTWRLVPFLY
jgi:protein-S-isoprenylcysteine O-methyltransferase Ste14